MAFSEERIDDYLDNVVMHGVMGGPTFSTTVVTVNGGFEQRNRNWLNARGSWQLGNRTFKESDLANLLDFFRARAGKAQGFRFRDWGDYKDMDRGILGTGLTSAGVSSYQMQKKYTSGADSYVRTIYKPIASTIAVFYDGNPIAHGTAFGQCQVNSVTGVVSFNTKDVSITGISKATQAVITATNSYSIGDQVYFSNINGMKQMNGLVGNVVAAGSSSFTVDINSSAFSTYTSGGIGRKHFVVSGKSISWTGQFDTPVRFDTDDFKYQIDDVTIDASGVRTVYANVGNLPIVEIRL